MIIPRKYSHFVFGVLQSGITCAIASGIATYNAGGDGNKVLDWLVAWGVSWLMMLPVVFLFAPLLRRAVDKLTYK